MFKKLFKYQSQKKLKVIYSCVIDNNPKFYWQGYIFINSLIKLANVDGKRIFVHMVGKNEEFEKFLVDNNVNIKYIEPWGDKKYCNKLQQLETQELHKADFVFFCDADIAITKDLASIVTKDIIYGKVVDFDNPSIDILEKIYDYFDVNYPQITNDTLNKKPTFETNFNGGLYGIPSKYISSFVKQWKSFAKEMLESREIVTLLREKINHIDQISFSLALKSSNIAYSLLGFSYNCPTHVQAIKDKIDSDVKVIHYHSNLSNIGLLNLVRNKYIDSAINKINVVLQNDFNNKLFWNYRYKTNPELGSGVGSRGEVASYKLDILKLIGLESDNSVLGIECGDLGIVKNLNLKNYTGVDISEEALRLARNKYPQHNFVNMNDKIKIGKADTVLCLDVLIHQPTVQEYKELVSFVSNQATKRVIISGYENKIDNSHICFFYENIRKTLEDTKQFKYVFKIGEYRGLGLYVADKEELSIRHMPNDMENSVVNNTIEQGTVNKDLLLESILVSRSSFGWFTKHYPRLYEYPWLLEKVGRDLEDLRIADFGAGITPLPLQLAQRGANVTTIDKHDKTRTLENVQHANEWGFFDYSCISDKIKSHNEILDESLFKKSTFDIWYSISVIEHMTAEIRRDILKIMKRTLKDNGRIYLTVDLVKNKLDLWNMAEGKEVEEKSKHGTLSDIEKELIDLGFVLEETKVLRMPSSERVDIAMIRGTLNNVYEKTSKVNATINKKENN